MFSTNDYYEKLRQVCDEKSNPDYALKQAAYMKHHFDFFGMKAPVWQAMAKDFFQQNGIFKADDLRDFVAMCFEDDCRELHYLAIEMVQKVQKKESENFIHFFEYMILTKSWWDSVDWIAKLVGIHFKRFPHLIVLVTEDWMSSGEMWLQRVAIIFQLRYRQNTDFSLLQKYILEVAHSKAFFLQKAAGWALREYSRHNPSGVRDFVYANPQLAALTKREATRLLAI